MKILYISHFDYTIWRFKMPLMNKLVRDGHCVYVLCPVGRVSNRFEDYGITHVPLNLKRDNKNVLNELSVILQIRKRILEIDPSIVHTFTIRPNIYGSFANQLLLSRRKLIFNHIMGLGSLYPLENKSYNFKKSMIINIINILMYLAFRKSSKVIVLNGDDMRYLIDRKIVNIEQITLVKGEGVMLNEYVPSCRITSSNIKKSVQQCVNILMVSRLIKEKGIYEYVAASRLIKKKYKQKVCFVFVGGLDNGNPSCLKRSEYDSLNNEGCIKFEGQQEDMLKYYHDADIFCLPSYYREGLPMTLLEAMASGLPIVTTDAPGCRDTVDEGVNGFKVPVRDVNALVDRLEQLILDPDLRIRMGRASRLKAEREFAVDKIVDQHMKLYEEVLNNKKI